MGAVPVVLNTNPFGVGLSEESGAVPVASLEEMPSAVMRLLRDPQRLAELRARGMRSVPAELNWDQYLDRVETALRIPAPEDPAAQARALIGDGLRVREELLRGDLDWEREKVADLNRVKAEREELVAELERVKARIREMQRTRAWRLAVRVRRTRDRVRRVIR
jgi:hypothetical protein